MAKRVKLEKGAGATGPAEIERSWIDPAEFQRIAREINRQKVLSSEYQGSAGKLTRDAIDKHNLNRIAFGFYMRLSTMDEAKRQDVIRSVFDYIERGGYLDQIDLYSDITDQLSGMLDRLKDRRPTEPRHAADDPVTAAILN
jgi:hypothetical protein